MRRTVLVTAVLLIAASACRPGGQQEDGRPLAVTTVSPITNIVENIGGDRIRVTGLVPEGVNSHTFEPAPSDARLLADAAIVFMNGLNLEEPTRKLADANVREGTRIVKLAEGTITPSEYIFDFSFPEAGGDPNPHLWTHPRHAERYARIIAEELTRIDPEGANGFATNLAAFEQRIDALDRAVREVTGTVPAEHRKLLTYHDSFPYFARAYGWTIIGAIQPADFAEPTPREVKRLIDQVRGARVPAIFGSEVFPSPVLKQIAKEAGARYVDDLRDDDLPGEPGDPEHSYLGLMVFNLRTIVTALRGDASALDAVETANLEGAGSATYRS